MYIRSDRILLSNTHFAISLRSDTAFGLMYTRSTRILLADTLFAILLRSDTDLGLMHTRSARSSAFRHPFRYFVAF
jgi:hypothetical protein